MSCIGCSPLEEDELLSVLIFMLLLLIQLKVLTNVELLLPEPAGP